MLQKLATALKLRAMFVNIKEFMQQRPEYIIEAQNTTIFVFATLLNRAWKQQKQRTSKDRWFSMNEKLNPLHNNEKERVVMDGKISDRRNTGKRKKS